MTRLVLSALLALASITSTAQARCSETHATMSCPQGQVWDETAKGCIIQSS